uniref:Putative secreted protein n=1 Tax=Ixodes scapularis TaxID=6945 RepID=A0A4D5S6T2_IXOSC
MPRGRRGAAASLPLFGFPAATGTRLHPDELSRLSARRQEVSRAACVTRGAPLRSLPRASSCNNRRVACETPCERIFPDAGCHSRVVLAFPGSGVHLSVKFILVLLSAVGAQHWHESVGDACPGLLGKRRPGSSGQPEDPGLLAGLLSGKAPYTPFTR